MKKSYIFQLEMMVRDYECDIQGIVNNANYLHFMEHTRHQFLLTEGVSFIDLHHRGIDCVVARITVSFKTPLKSDDRFISCLNIRKDGVKYVFEHKDSDDVNIVCEQLFDLAMISHRPLQPEKMTKFIERSNKILAIMLDK